ncbi:MAG: hypothetical protein QM750_23005 [Rubrivivax sp.]
MIHVPRRGAVPAPLAGPDSLAARERAANEQALREGRPLSFKVYRHEVVKARLCELFNFKCAYCESDIRATAPGDVEHFRPKGKITVRGADGKVQSRPGYPWLAAEWSNLLLSCTFCNSPNKQQVRSLPKRTLGKANWFPLADERRRAKTPRQVAREPRLLLDPCTDKPEQHLAFTPEGDIQPRRVRGKPSAMGEATIETCGLARIGLMQRRAAHRRIVESLILDIRDAIEAGRPPARKLALLTELMAAGSDYAAFTRSLVRAQLGPWLRRLGL